MSPIPGKSVLQLRVKPLYAKPLSSGQSRVGCVGPSPTEIVKESTCSFGKILPISPFK